MKRRIFFDAGAGGGGGAMTEQEKLLVEIKKTINTELETRGYKKADDVATLINKAFEGLPIEALRAFKVEETVDTVKRLAGDFEKLKNRGDQKEQKLNAIRTALQDEKFMESVERVFNSRQANTEVVLNTRAAAIMTITDNVAVNDGNIPEDILNSFSVDAFTKKRRPYEYIWDVVNRVTVAAVTQYKTWMEEGDEEGAFAIVAEGGLKPLVSTGLVRNTSQAKKLAGKRVYTEEFVKFRKEAYNIIEQLLSEKLTRDYAALIVADLITASAAYTGTTLDDQIVAPNDYHAIGAVAAQIESLDFIPDTLIINPQDKWRMALAQTSTGEFYTTIPVYSANGDTIIMGFRVITSTRVTAGDLILGESRLYKIEEEPVSIRMGYGIEVTKDGANVTNVTSDFDNNRFRIIAEMFFHSYISSSYTGSWVKTTFATVKTALLKP